MTAMTAMTAGTAGATGGLRRRAFSAACMALAAGLGLGLITSQSQAAPLEPTVMESDARVSRDGPLWLLAGRPMTGTLKRVAPDGVVTLLPMHQGQAHGWVVSRFANGQLRGEGSFAHGQTQGVHRAWWPSGQLQSEQSFSFDKPHGPLRTWYASGRPYQAHHYAQGQEAGPQRVWFEDQRIRANYVVQDGRRYGSIGTMNCDGRPRASTPQTAAAQAGATLAGAVQAGVPQARKMAPLLTASVVEWSGAQTP